jgi:hypothetical protein
VWLPECSSAEGRARDQCVYVHVRVQADAHRMEVPRMLCKLGRLDDLEDYVLNSDDPQLLRWCVRCEHKVQGSTASCSIACILRLSWYPTPPAAQTPRACVPCACLCE